MQARSNRRNDKTDWVISPPDEIHPTFGGAGLIGLARAFAPRPEEIRRMLLALREQHRWSQGFAASMLGVSMSALVKWEAGTREPRGCAAKMIFLLYGLLIDKEKVKNCWDVAL